MGQINRKTLNLITYILGLPKDLRPTGSQAIETSLPSRAKEVGVGVWVLKRKEGNAQKMKKNKCLVN